MLIKEKRKNKRIKLILLMSVAIITVSVILIENYLEPLQDRLIINRTKSVVEHKFSQVIKKIINNKAYNYDNLLIKSESDGSVTSLSVNTKELNKLEADFSDEIQSRLDGVVEGYIEIPLGDLTTLSFLSGTGPKIPFSYDITGSVNINLNSSFDNTGINQTIHRVSMEVNADILFITVEDTENLNITNEYIISETVIVGTIPNYVYKY